MKKNKTTMNNEIKARNIERKMKAYYQREQKREYDRNYEYFKTGKGKLLDRLDLLLADLEGESCDPGWISDRGAGARRIADNLDRGRDLLADASAKVKREAPLCLPTFLLIVENGKNRQRSIRALMKHPFSQPEFADQKRSYAAAKKIYFRQRKKILKLFGIPMFTGV